MSLDPGARPRRGPTGPAGPGLVIESATARVDVLACDAAGLPLARAVEDVSHGHTRRLTPLVTRVLREAGLEPRALAWTAADLGPGSFTGVRVGLATAEAIALAAGVPVRGASSLAALALAAAMTRPPAGGRELLVPLVPGGRRDVYAGFFHADARGRLALMAAPRVATTAAVIEAVAEARALLPRNAAIRFLGPGAAREREALERAFPGAAEAPWRAEGLSALDLALAVRVPLGPAVGLPAAGEEPRPLYVRSAQAEERVRRAALAGQEPRLRPLELADLPAVAALEERVFSDAWPESFFREELAHPLAYARIAATPELPLAGYLLAWVGPDAAHIGNLGVAPEARRRGVARALLDDLLARARAAGAPEVTLEVRASNFAAQALYRGHGFRLAGLRRGYYRDTGEDALVMAWRAADVNASAGGPGHGSGAAAGPPSTSDHG
jgi:tRNA threonylcarbamoyl adenosine modification protein YeaZ/ribosomal-protein-alanine acetyltransferase